MNFDSIPLQYLQFEEACLSFLFAESCCLCKVLCCALANLSGTNSQVEVQLGIMPAFPKCNNECFLFAV